MPALVGGIHAFSGRKQDVDGRNKSGHDDERFGQLHTNRVAALAARVYLSGMTTTTHFAVFDTAIGACAVIWGANGISGAQLPDKTESATRARIARRHPDAREAAPPAAIAKVIADIVALLGGERRDLSDVVLDLARAPEFHRRVYDIARTIPPGRTMTYGEIATRLGDRLLARDVGEALGKNPIPIIVPCHRVLAADGKTGGFSAPGGVATKLRMLSIEGARAGAEPLLFDKLDLATRPR
jgi:methylated-DNA-[protein]-cysteine S-methyltransferase